VLEHWDAKSTRHGVALIVAEQRRLRLAEPWAIAELRPTDDDYQRLLAWASYTTGDTLARRAEKLDRAALPDPASDEVVSLAAQVGLLLLTLVSEAVRREGSTYAVWPAVAHAARAVPGIAALITDTGGATAAFKHALESAATRFVLIGDDFQQTRTNRWYRLLLLNAGIADHDIPSVPRWLDDPGASFLTRELVGLSPSFRGAWETLAAHRRGNATRDDARRELARCPFVRTSSIDAVLDAATARAPSVPETPGEQAFDVAMTLEWERGKEPTVLLTPSFGRGAEFGSEVKISVNGAFRQRQMRTASGYISKSRVALPVAEEWSVVAEGETEENSDGSPERFETIIHLFDDEGRR
jgi:hypothetical protein